jgi:hypothetical protein
VCVRVCVYVCVCVFGVFDVYTGLKLRALIESGKLMWPWQQQH